MQNNEDELIDIDGELDALLSETVRGLRKRINADDPNATDFQAASKLLALTGRLEGIRDDAERKRTEQTMQGLKTTFENLPNFDENGVIQ